LGLLLGAALLTMTFFGRTQLNTQPKIIKKVEDTKTNNRAAARLSKVEELEKEILMLKRKDRLLDRTRKIRNVCTEYSSPHPETPVPNPNVLYNVKYSFTICRMQKVASSSWLQTVMITDGFYTYDEFWNNQLWGNEAVKFARQKRRLSSLNSTREMDEIWMRSQNIITVRHPFKRLVSAYLDKLLHKSSGYYNNVASYIEKNNHYKRINVNDRYTPLTGEPTFEDYINFIVDTSSNKNYKGDTHWSDYQKLCDPCRHKYDLVLKLETIEEDLEYLRDRLKIPDDAEGIMTVSQNKHEYDFMTYFNELPQPLFEQVYDMYKEDFEMFGYEKPS